ncbi:hypothetical protein O3M35_003277 [Rhynocoris fuscipes]|uniref:Uncharacterized protein n=1 Tax=Rhynocoris fuscipes TaxID=488301 RepID=A0AAW1CJJ8_9HEMI
MSNRSALLLVVMTGSAAFSAITFSVYNAWRNLMLERSFLPHNKNAKVPQFESYTLPNDYFTK